MVTDTVTHTLTHRAAHAHASSQSIFAISSFSFSSLRRSELSTSSVMDSFISLFLPAAVSKASFALTYAASFVLKALEPHQIPVRFLELIPQISHICGLLFLQLRELALEQG